MNWLSLAPYAAILLIGLYAGYERIEIAGLETTVAKKGGALSDMRAQQAENISTAVKAVAADKDADAVKTTALVAVLTKDKQALEERANAAEIALAAVPETVAPVGCPAAMDSPVFRAWIDGLPRP